ncbi:hypothetical protein FLJC2902T_15450 [Flavobacterium limnosediminis JC2902]|uniref:Uncharacterized protein n=1 Tax=Flavobacterium limnosediminis JC2902 TaxID=1341181 RepID=V6SUW4_9FLAO|nr:hypothetical protein FLJC2902T_15450 [Flavobacterium limnosediminis JC2902]
MFVFSPDSSGILFLLLYMAKKDRADGGKMAQKKHFVLLLKIKKSR